MFDSNILNAFLSLSFLVLLLGGILFALKYLAKKRNKSTSDTQLEVISRVSLQPKTHMYIVKVGNKKLLIGATDNSISTLADLSEKKQISKSEEASLDKNLQTMLKRNSVKTDKVQPTAQPSQSLSFKSFLKSTLSKS